MDESQLQLLLFQRGDRCRKCQRFRYLPPYLVLPTWEVRRRFSPSTEGLFILGKCDHLAALQSVDWVKLCEACTELLESLELILAKPTFSFTPKLVLVSYAREDRERPESASE